MTPTLKVKNLEIGFNTASFKVHKINMELYGGSITCIVGESGSGKSTLLKAIAMLSDEDALVSGNITLNGTDITKLSENELREKRFTELSVVFQNSKEYLNPKLKLREQLFEVLRKKYSEEESEKRAGKLMRQAGLTEEDLDMLPSELSGGMVQKFQIACAIALSPSLIVFDEPTSSLDIASRNEFVDLVKSISENGNMAILVVTHDLTFARELSETTYVMYNGMVCEVGPSTELITSPAHPYTRALLNSAMDINPYKDIWGIRMDFDHINENECPFYRRCNQSTEVCTSHYPVLTQIGDTGRAISCNRGGIVRVMDCEHISKSFGKKVVLEDCSMHINSGEIVSIVGKTGSGKTTFCKIASGFLPGDKGAVGFNEQPADFAHAYRQAGGLQMLMQDCDDALNPNMSVLEAVREPLYIEDKTQDYSQGVKCALRDVGLEHTDEFLSRKIKTMSGGQKQRIAIARGLITKPAVLIADEPTSMLDSSSKASIIRLLKGLQNEKGFSMLMVTHDLPCAMKISDRIYQIKDSRMYEISVREIIRQHPELASAAN